MTLTGIHRAMAATAALALGLAACSGAPAERAQRAAPATRAVPGVGDCGAGLAGALVASRRGDRPAW